MLYGILAKYLSIFGVAVGSLVVAVSFGYELGSKQESYECEKHIQNAVSQEREKFRKISEIKERVDSLPDSEFDKWLLDNGHAKPQ